MRQRQVVCAAMVASLACAFAAAEDGESRAPGKTAVYGQLGVSSGSYDMAGGAFGGVFVRDLGARLAIEGTGAYLGHGMGSSALSLSASLLVQLRPRTEKVVPYLAFGGGLYRTSFDMGDRQSSSMGGMMSYGMMTWGGPVSTWPTSAPRMPMFYANRLERRTDWQARGYGRESFNDPAIGVGAGMRINLGSRVFLRPDARALMVTADGDRHTVGVFTVNVGYGF